MGKNRDFSKFPNAITVLDSGNVGIGTSSPASLLTLFDSTTPKISFQNSGAIRAAIQSDSSSLILNSVTGNDIRFQCDSTERMRINSGGGINIGSGGVNAFSNGLTSFNLDMATVGLFSYSAQLYLFNNTYHNGSTGFYYKYTGSGVGGMVVENAGNITFVTAPSGTAGNLVTLSTRMIISETGNVAIGTSSPQRLLDVRGTVNLSTTAPTVSATSGAYADIHLRTFSGASSSPARISVVDNWIEYVATFTDGHRFRNYSSNGVLRELMTITSTGNVGIGTSTPSYSLDINGMARILRNGGDEALRISNDNGYIGFFNTANSTRSAYIQGNTTSLQISSSLAIPIMFLTSDAERMRISSNGNVGVGTTLSTYRMQIAKVSTAAPALMISGAFYGGPRIQTYGLDADANAWMGLGTDMGGAAYEHSLYYSTNGRQTMGSYDGTTYTTRFYMLANGNYLFSGTNLSDIRLKENIESITLTASEKIALLNPCSYNMKDDISVTRYGFIAQEVQNILPDLIRGGSDKHEDYMGLDYDGVFTITVKAVQEILVRLKALENK